MIFKPGDKVMYADEGPFTLASNDSATYPLSIGNTSFTSDGRGIVGGAVHLTLAPIPGIKNYTLGQVQTLDNGIQIYHPTNGQPFQLIPTTKALL